MRPLAAWGLVAALAALTTAAFVLPLEHAALLAVASVIALRRRRGFLLAAFVGAALNVAIYAAILHGPGLDLPVVPLSRRGAWIGLAGAVRLSASLGVNLAVLSRVPVEAVLDGLRLPPAATGFLAAVLVAAHDLGRDHGRLRDAARLDGRWPVGWLARLRASAALVPPLVVLAVRHARVRAEALRLAGHDTAPRFAALVAVTALACAGRMAVLAVPNDPVTYLVIFLGGLLFGVATGALAGLLAMSLTNLLISGLQPAAFANAPAMALLGLLGGLVGRARVGREDSWTTAAVSALCGLAGVLLFSIAADGLTWALVPESRAAGTGLLAYIGVGLAFNVVPAVAAAIVFALAVGPVARAAEAGGLRDRPR